MPRKPTPLVCLVVLPVFLLSAGCYDASLPQSMMVVLSAQATLEAPLDSGPDTFANSTWAMYEARESNGQRSALPDKLLIRIEFGPDGQIARAFDNVAFGADTIGLELVPDGEVHATPFPGAAYVAGSYGGRDGENVGFAASGHFLIGPSSAATATIYAYGTLNQAGDRIDGVLGYDLVVAPIFEELLMDITSSIKTERRVYAVRER